MLVSDNKAQVETSPLSGNYYLNGKWFGLVSSSGALQTQRVYNRVGFKQKPFRRNAGLQPVLEVHDSSHVNMPSSSTGSTSWTVGTQRWFTDNTYAACCAGHQNTINSYKLIGSDLILDKSALSDQLMLDAAGHMPPASSLLVDLAEIGQVISMVTSCKGLLTQLPKQLRRLRQPATGRAFGSVIKDLAGLDLMYKFGISPLIDTMTALHAWESKVQARLNELAVRNQQEFFQIRKRRVSEISGGPGSTTVGDGPQLISYHRVDSCVVSAFAKATYNINAHSAWELTQDYFNLNAFTQLLWDLTPFSFVADWFLSVGRIAEVIDTRLSKYDSTPIGSATLICPCTSYKVVQTAKIGRKTPSYYKPPNVVWTCDRRSVRFDRTPGLPSGLPPLLSGSGWNSWRIGTGAELVIQLAGHR